MTQYELESRWLTAAGVAGVNYRFSDLVRIRSGEYAGHAAEVIALLALDPEPMYMVIVPPNEKIMIVPQKSVVLPQSELEPTGATGGSALELGIKEPPARI